MGPDYWNERRDRRAAHNGEQPLQFLPTGDAFGVCDVNGECF